MPRIYNILPEELEIFKHTLWANIIYNPNDYDIIIENRMELKNKFKLIKKNRRNILRGNRQRDEVDNNFKNNYIDHQELYIDEKKNYFYIISPYNDQCNINKIISDGWTQLPYSIYKKDTFSFYKYFPRIKNGEIYSL